MMNMDQAAKTIQEQPNAEILLYSPQWWREKTLMFSQSRDILSLKILEKIYVSPAHPYVLPSLQRQLLSINRSKVSVWYRCKKLEENNLVRILRGSPISIYAKDEILPENIKQMLILCYGRLQLNASF